VLVEVVLVLICGNDDSTSALVSSSETIPRTRILKSKASISWNSHNPLPSSVAPSSSGIDEIIPFEVPILRYGIRYGILRLT
jgi:hypothetical protein